MREEAGFAVFQSTLPLRGATTKSVRIFDLIGFQSTLPLRGATAFTKRRDWHPEISIHAPLTGSDDFLKIVLRRNQKFQSTLPLRGATHVCLTSCEVGTDFNPRSPYGERPSIVICFTSLKNFNPRSPYGERLRMCTHPWGGSRFQSTLPLRGATRWRSLHVNHKIISIHAPLTGSDFVAAIGNYGYADFNPRSPYGERRHGI